MASTQFWYTFWYVVIKDTKIDKMFRAGLNVHSRSNRKEDCALFSVVPCVVIACIFACVCLLSAEAGQTVTPQLWFAVTSSVQVSLRETPNPCSTAKPQRCCSVANTPRWPLCSVSSCGSARNQKDDEKTKTKERGGAFLHSSSFHLWNLLSKALIKFTTSKDFTILKHWPIPCLYRLC